MSNNPLAIGNLPWPILIFLAVLVLIGLNLIKIGRRAIKEKAITSYLAIGPNSIANYGKEQRGKDAVRTGRLYKILGYCFVVMGIYLFILFLVIGEFF